MCSKPQYSFYIWGVFRPPPPSAACRQKVQAVVARHWWAWQVAKAALAYYILLSYLGLGLTAGFKSGPSPLRAGVGGLDSLLFRRASCSPAGYANAAGAPGEGRANFHISCACLS